MSAGIVALLMSLGTATWVFTKLQQHTGYGNNQNAVAGAGLVFVICFIVTFSLAHMLLH